MQRRCRRGALDPMVVLRSPSHGQYDIWVGSYSRAETIEGTLRLTALRR